MSFIQCVLFCSLPLCLFKEGPSTAMSYEKAAPLLECLSHNFDTVLLLIVTSNLLQFILWGLIMFIKAWFFGQNASNPASNHSLSANQTVTDFSKQKQERIPDTYSGGHSNLNDYLCHFEAVSHYNGWSHQEKGINLAISLRDGAQQVLQELSSKKKGKIMIP